MRPLYESHDNRLWEAQALQHFARRFGVRAVQLPPKSPVDGRIEHNGKTVAYAEFKRRNNRMWQYPDFEISNSKIEHGFRVADAEGVEFLLLVWWKDGLFYARCPREYQTRPGGRTDRGDPWDQETMAVIDLDLFQPVREAP